MANNYKHVHIDEIGSDGRRFSSMTCIVIGRRHVLIKSVRLAPFTRNIYFETLACGDFRHDACAECAIMAVGREVAVVLTALNGEMYRRP